jgi:hypothetical protein
VAAPTQRGLPPEFAMTCVSVVPLPHTPRFWLQNEWRRDRARGLSGFTPGSLALSPGDPVPPSSFAHLFRLLQQTMGKGGSSNCSLRVDNLAGAALASSMHIKQTGHIRKTYRKNDGAVIGWGGRQHLGRILFVRALSQREPAIDVIRRAVNAPPLRCLAQHGLS